MNKFLVLLFLFLGLLFLFPKVSVASSKTLTSTAQAISQINPSVSLLISFKNGQSPNDLQTELKKAKADESTVGGFLNKQILKMLNKKIQSEIIQERILNIESVKKKAHVISISKMNSIKSISPDVYLIQLTPGTDSASAIKELKKLSEVKSVIPNFILKAQNRPGASIQSTENTQGTVQFIVKYKKDQAPEQIQARVESRLSMMGQISRIADVASGEPSPEEKMNNIRQTWEKLDYVYSKDVYSSNWQSNELLQNTEVVTFQNTSTNETIIREYKKLPEVQAIIPNFIIRATNTPNDTNFNKLWGMKKIQAETAWDTTQGSNDITVAVIDSGIDYNHEDLRDNYKGGTDYSTCNDTDEEQKFAPPGTCYHPKARDSNPMDDAGHGTHVAGTIGATGNNGKGVTGVNWHVKLLAVKVLGVNGVGFLGDILDGIDYSVQNGAKVINMSLGYPLPSPYTCKSSSPDLQIIRDVIAAAKNAGVTIVVAAGNDHHDARNDLYASCPNVIAVGATGPNDERASYSNYGSDVIISAPGGVAPCETNCIFSTFPNPSYKMLGGTSMAAPHVAGAAALLLSINPNLTPDQIRNALIQNADTISTDRPIGPRLNLAKAVAAVSGAGTPTPTGAGTPTPTGAGTPTPTEEVSPTPTGAGTPTPTGETSPTPTGETNPTPTNTPDVTPTPTDVQPTETPEPTVAVTPTPPQEISWDITFSFKLPGIGTSAGDTNNPLSPNIPVYLTFVGEDGNSHRIKLNDAAVYSDGIFKENQNGGTMEGDIPAAGTYQVKLSINNTLNKLIPGFFTITNNPVLNLPLITLTPGDITQDNTLDLLDYNILVSCIQESCTHDIFSLADFNNDGLVDAKDLNVFLRQLETRAGD